MDLSFYKNKKILVTGHTGFKGSWLCMILEALGANVTGYSLQAPTVDNLFEIAGIDKRVNSIIGDVRDFEHMKKVFENVHPEIVFHLAAQPIVRTGYQNPIYTYETNVMGTVNVCECVRLNPCVKSFLNITTDKVYENKEWQWGYRENERLNGYDPYSNSKSCSELVTSCYMNSFFESSRTAVSTARAGNVIGGGDFSGDRIIPDCVRAIIEKKDIKIRNPHSTRPYQHVLESLHGYMLIAMRQYENLNYSGNYNIGPDECDCVTTGDLVDLFCRKWNGELKWVNCAEKNAPHEANFLKLDCSKMKSVFGWRPVWHIDTAVEKVVEWTNAYINGESIEAVMKKQIKEYEDVFDVK